MDVAIGVLLIAAALLLPPRSAAESCPCPEYDLAAIVARSDAILVGKVLSATTDSIPESQRSDGTWWWNGAAYRTRLTVEVSRVLKGTPPHIVEVVTPTGLCGFQFVVGETYLIAGVGRGATVTTDVCHGNAKGEAIDFRAGLIEDQLHPGH